MSEDRGAKQMETSNMVRAYQREWLKNTRERLDDGEHFAICNGDDFEEVFNVMDIPVMCVNYWHALITMKGLAPYYQNIFASKNYSLQSNATRSFSMGLASTMDRKPDVAPWGGLPKPTVIMGGGRTDTEIRTLELWARQFGCAYWPLEFALWHGIEKAPDPYWFERMRDHWDEYVDPKKLDLRIEDEKTAIRFLEVITGKKFSLAKLTKALELVNEQMDYWKAAHDLIAETVPSPVSLRDQLSMYQMMWHRGTPKARDLFKAYYEEVKYRAEKGIAAYPKEKYRLLWMTSLGTPAAWSRWAEEKYDAVCVASAYGVIARDSYPRTILNNDPLRTMAARHMLLFWSNAEWHINEAKRNKCDGVALCPPRSAEYVAKYTSQGLPLVGLPHGDKDNDEVRGILTKWFETEILPKKKRARK